MADRSVAERCIHDHTCYSKLRGSTRPGCSAGESQRLYVNHLMNKLNKDIIEKLAYRGIAELEGSVRIVSQAKFTTRYEASRKDVNVPVVIHHRSSARAFIRIICKDFEAPLVVLHVFHLLFHI